MDRGWEGWGRLCGSVGVAESRDLAQEGGGRATQQHRQHQDHEQRAAEPPPRSRRGQRGQKQQMAIHTSASMQYARRHRSQGWLCLCLAVRPGKDVPIG